MMKGRIVMKPELGSFLPLLLDLQEQYHCYLLLGSGTTRLVYYLQHYFSEQRLRSGSLLQLLPEGTSTTSTNTNTTTTTSGSSSLASSLLVLERRCRCTILVTRREFSVNSQRSSNTNVPVRQNFQHLLPAAQGVIPGTYYQYYLDYEWYGTLVVELQQ